MNYFNEWWRNTVAVVGTTKTYASVPNGYILISEHKRLEELEDPLDTNHIAVKSDIAEELSRKITGSNTKEIVRNALMLVVNTVAYDSIHSNASVNWRTMAYTYMRADEALRTNTGICGEQSLALVSILRYKGIKASLIRPYISHIRVIVEDGDRYYIADTVSESLWEYVGPLRRFAKSHKSKYIIGVITVDEFYKYTIIRRKKFGWRIKHDITAEEALDLEYARHCYRLPFKTELGKAFVETLFDIGYCRRLFRDSSLAIMFGNIISDCGRPEEEVNRLCYKEAWEYLSIRLYDIHRRGGNIWRYL